ncbi:UDP-N-acetylmuramoyl-L-alanyl-D-glutamate--2,6-diaminopimelate ligase MurE homolog, chloroplastic isoform X1 [Olea europaea var. sylvestris]|uniref:UDP-N-acetylmuramoyl-L-alanyl-D-glutamate--2, 6-diaminopimelate ligase MurE homolog, chloroplastic isoform X1 n=1 Tax=Olea europaea var. sylvestris TaxID=158386 RepID=UPI000C1D3BBB|nr:UDP-N-acetylmuramoyl-L-alanyl-D-glutamate--2,6-diaminopimelate ligase MurE homolog, chloroplastic isoform X1 [Olea europaea var. sylvestris]XP_022873850.1 UDP-N-acetylmuramoyl-L-alanyl-D-glutamate--2,6-diaminopimelate ligase MurE homolog, chloroplastic isoform X1 [Olea europaea var. sylvestris]XP_022873851.1 UDP-N-acetylmuramoyl-L-alanyl-D-glutamate--2,6-diaminopimelate ligase MurE homolog, chloroplastic isoform X1 [Olea europaea var. sylvestris]
MLLSVLSLPLPPPVSLSHKLKLAASLPFLQHHYLCFRPPLLTTTTTSVSAIGPDGKFYPTPSDDDPPEAPEDSMHGVNKFQQIHRQASRARKIQEEDFKKNQPVFLKALEETEDNPNALNNDDSGDDLFGEIDKAIALKRQEFIKKGLIKQGPNGKPKAELEKIEELEPEEVVDLDEIKELQGLTEISDDENESEIDESFERSDLEASDGEFSSKLSSFDIDFDEFGKTKARIVEPKFKMSLVELLDESKVVPIAVYGNLEVEISGISHDSRVVESGDLFVCCVGMKTDGHLFLSEADKRGAVAVVASKEVDIEETLGCKALVIVEDTNAVLAALAASFYRYPSNSMSVIGISGTNGKTTTSYLIKSMYEAMGLRTGMLSTVAYYIHGDNKLESPNTTPDSVLIQKLMAKMVHNGTEALVMEASSHGLALGRCDEVDFDIAVFSNLTRDHLDFHGTEEEYRDAKAKLFSKMVDPERHRKVVNIDDVNAAFFIAQGSPDVPVVTFAMENKKADVHPLKFELSLFETQVLVNTPQGILEISSGLLGRHNIYNILAAVAVGIAVGAPLEDIVRGIEEVDAVPGRCELIDEEQAFGVIVDYAHTPDALSRLLDYVRELGPRRVITVFGCAGESDRGKRPMMTKIATDKSDITILTSDNPKNEDPFVSFSLVDILDDMLAGVGWTMQDYLKHGENDYYPPLSNGHRLFLHDIRRVAVRCAVAMGEEGDMVVVAGKGHETYQIEGDKKEFFDDREECREALQYVDELHQAGIDTSEFPWRLPESH